MSEYADDVLVGGLPDFAEMLRQREEAEMQAALARARKAHLLAYPVLGFGDGWFAVPSQSEFGHVYLVQLNLHSGQPNACTCPNPKKWCTHSGAARIFYDAAREADDTERQRDAGLHILELREQHDA